MSFASALQGLVGQAVTIYETGGNNQTGTITALDAANDKLTLSVSGLSQQWQISNITSVRSLS